MDDDKRLIQARIRRAVDEGTLTKASAKKGLLALIDEELSQNERPADQALLDACSELLRELEHAPQHTAPKPPELPKRVPVHGRLHRFACRFAKIAAVLFAVSLCASLIACQGDLIERTTESGPQHQIKRDITGSVAVSQGDEAGTPTAQETATLEEAIQLLGFDPRIPQWTPDGWAVDRFAVSVTPLSRQFHMTYSRAGESAPLQYDVLHYDDVETVVSNYEQDGAGAAHRWNGRSVYTSTNAGLAFAVWTEGSRQHSLSGPVTQEDLRRMIESL